MARGNRATDNRVFLSRFVVIRIHIVTFPDVLGLSTKLYKSSSECPAVCLQGTITEYYTSAINLLLSP